jgi:hypothetical protein
VIGYRIPQSHIRYNSFHTLAKEGTWRKIKILRTIGRMEEGAREMEMGKKEGDNERKTEFWVKRYAEQKK